MSTIQLKCKNCNHANDYDSNELEWECVSADERQMGMDSNYVADIEFSCDKCGNEITGQFNYWEYPEGSINNEETTLNGATLISDENLIYNGISSFDEDDE
jgi:hypothetical protein